MLSSIGRLGARIRSAAYALLSLVSGSSAPQPGTTVLTEDGHAMLAEDGTPLISS
jgi:hypothetical protein